MSIYTSDGPRLSLQGWTKAASVTVKGGFLLPEGRSPREVRADDELLGRFLLLTAAEDQEVARYARRYGLMGLCREHELPHGPRSAFPVPGLPQFSEAPCVVGQGGLGPHREPVAAWRRMAQQAQSMCQISEKLRARSLQPHPLHHRPCSSQEMQA